MSTTSNNNLPIACPPPRIRYSSTAVQLNSSKLIYVFGGTGGQKHSQYWNDLYILDAQTWTWLEPTTCKGQIPLPRYGHTATLIEVLDENYRDRKREESSPTFTVPTKKKMILFGGKSYSPHLLLNDVYELDLDSLTWKKLHIRGDNPQSRYYHSATDIGNGKILIFGGRSDSGELSDVVILDVPNGQWIYPPVSGKSPTKRYQHSAYFDSKKEYLYIYGGINRMTSLRDLNILSLRGEEEETMQWIKPKLQYDVEMDSKAHDYALFVGGKVVILDFAKMNRERKLDYLRFDEDEVFLDTLDIVGNVPEMSQFYSFTSFPHEHILLEIKKQTSLYLLRTDARLFERETLEIKKIDVTIPSLPIVPNPSLQIPVECHHASTPLYTFEISPTTTFQSLVNTISRKYHLDHSSLLLYQRNHYVHLNSEKFPGILRRQEDGPLKIYVAASTKEDMKKKNIDFLATEAALLGTSPSEFNSDSVSEKSEDIREYKKKEEIAVPLPKLFGKPVKLSFVRWMHKKMKQFEARGLTHTLLATDNATDETVPLLKKKDMNKKEHFNYKVAMATFLRFLFLPLFTVTHIFRNASLKSKMTLLGLSILYLLCLFLPIATLMYEHLSHEDEFLGKANVFAPITIYFILIMTFSTIEGTWKFPQKMTQELGRYRVTILQRLVTDEYGERPAGGDEVVFALTNKEDTTKDKAWHKFITYLFPVIAAALHCLVTFFYLLETNRWQFSNDWKTHCLSALCLVLNFVMTWFFLFILGCSLTIYARQSTFIRYFNVLASKEQAESLDLPTLPLTTLENTMAWIKIRSYIKGHQFLPLTSANVVLGYSIIVGVVLWMMVAMQIFTSKEIFNNITVLIIYDAILMAIYIVLTLGIGAGINAYQEKHVTMLYKEQLKLSLKLRQIHVENQKSLEEEKDQLKTCREILHIFASMIEKQENVFSILGISMSETATKAIIGLTISITVAMIARIGVDLTE